jgi:hypothetical protein
MYVFRINKRACYYGGGCYKMHLADVDKTEHPLREVEAQLEREREFLGYNFKSLKRELVENVRSPYSAAKGGKV